eukprot:TRINITY_DN37594_c0_g1_i1.p1 TRINITY_DN37594_c0_g1~~TRINITY_DN37594_c0_g1_i1.p1  ORF type:complete len:127 (+),score=12.10 TRINITY_DN37594_c0_g1_i1:87-467(+)
MMYVYVAFRTFVVYTLLHAFVEIASYRLKDKASSVSARTRTKACFVFQAPLTQETCSLIGDHCSPGCCYFDGWNFTEHACFKEPPPCDASQKDKPKCGEDIIKCENCCLDYNNGATDGSPTCHKTA